MTQRTFRRTSAPSNRRSALWIPFGQSVASVVGTLFGAPAANAYGLPLAALRERDPALYDATDRAERTRRALDAERRPLLY